MPVFTGTPEEASAALFTGPGHAAMQYINQSVERFAARAAEVPGVIANTIIDKHRAMLASNASRKIEAMRHKIGNLGMADTIRPLWTNGAVQQAPNSMVRWVMANPTIREYYHDDRMEGYGDRYNDVQPEYVGKNQYDYRRVMDGVIEVDNETGEAAYSQYYEEIVDNDVVLTSLEKASIRLTWDAINDEMDEGNMDDPTSEWNSLIG